MSNLETFTCINITTDAKIIVKYDAVVNPQLVFRKRFKTIQSVSKRFQEFYIFRNGLTRFKSFRNVSKKIIYSKCFKTFLKMLIILKLFFAIFNEIYDFGYYCRLICGTWTFSSSDSCSRTAKTQYFDMVEGAKLIYEVWRIQKF